MAYLLAALKQIKTFLRLYSRVLRIALQVSSFQRILQIATFDLVGLGARTAVVGVVAYIVSTLETLERGIDHPIDDQVTIAIIGGLVFMLLLASAFAGYHSAANARRVGRNVHLFLAERTLIAIKYAQYLYIPEKIPNPGRLQQYVNRDPLHASNAAETILSSFQAIILLTGGICAVLYIAPVFSIWLLAATGLGLPAVYFVIRRTYENADQFHTTKVREMNQMMNETMYDLNASEHSPGIQDKIRETIEATPYVNFLVSMDEQRLATNKVKAVLSTVTAFIITISIFLYGSLVMSGDKSWSELIVFIGAFLFVMSGMQNLFSHLANLNKFYPQVRALFELLDELESARKPATTGFALPDRIALRTQKPITEMRKQFDLSLPGAATVVSDDHILRHNLQTLLRPIHLAQADSASPCDENFWYSASIVAYPTDFKLGTSIAETALHALANDAAARRSVTALFDLCDIANVIDRLPDGLDTPLSDKITGNWTPRTLAALQLLSVYWQRHPPVLVIGSKMLKQLEIRDPRLLLDAIPAHLILIFGPANEELSYLEDDVPIIVSKKGEIVALTDAKSWHPSLEGQTSSGSSTILTEEFL